MLSCYQNERRKHQRLSVNLTAVCRIAGPKKNLFLLNGNDFEARTHDMSEGGLSIISQHFIPVGSKLNIRLMVCEEDRKSYIKFYDIVRIYGTVKNSIVHEDDTFRLGIEFQEMDENQEDKIFYIMHSSLQEGNPYPFGVNN